MAVIFLYFALFLGVHFLSKQFKHPGAAKLFQMIACFVLLFGFFGFRDITILNDTSHYYGFYYQKAHIIKYHEESVFAFHLLDKFEYGFQILIHFLVKYVSKEAYTIILLSSLIFSVGNIYFLSRNTNHISLACFMMIISGVYFDQYSMIRQAFAIMLFYIAYQYLKTDKLKPYIILVLIGTLFHTSALFLLIIPILKRIEICRKNVLIIFCGAILLSLFIHTIMALLGLSETLYYKMSIKREAPPIAAILDGILMLFLIGVYLFSQKKECGRQDPTDFWICILGLCVCIITPSFIPLFRLNAYIWPIVYILFFNSLIGKRIFSLFVLFLLIRITVIITFKSEWNHIVPYSFYDWSDKYHEFHLYLQKEQ